jgi:hypothetical protein
LIALLLVAITAAGTLAASMTLVWTAPGDDGTVGRASRYELRYWSAPITTANYASTWRVNGLPPPKPAGATESFAVPNLVPGRKYYFAMKTMDDAGNWSPISNTVASIVPVTATEQPVAALSFSPPSPNPAYDSAHWTYALPVAGPVVIEIFDLAGRRVRTVTQSWQSAGAGQADWDLTDDAGRPVATGLYLVRAVSLGRQWVQRLSVAR